MEINIKSIPQQEQRYETLGDYWYDGKGVLQVRVTEMGKKEMMLVIFHELVEQFLTEQRGIKEEDIMKFDVDFEKNREEDNYSEPGDAENSPYKKEHRFAENIERLIAHEAGIDFNNYNNQLIA